MKKNVGRPKIYANQEEAYSALLERRKEKRKQQKDQIAKLTNELKECQKEISKLSAENLSLRVKLKETIDN